MILDRNDGQPAAEASPVHTPRRRLSEVKDACKYGVFGVTKCYELIREGRIRAYKFDHKTLIDLDSIDELHAAMPPIRPPLRWTRGSEAARRLVTIEICCASARFSVRG